MFTLVIIAAGFIVFFNVARATSTSLPFGGTVTKMPAMQVSLTEMKGYKCADGRNTFDIKKAPNTKSTGPYHFTPSFLKGIPATGKQILGKYTPKAKSIICKHSDPKIPPIIIQADKVMLYGVGKKSIF